MSFFVVEFLDENEVDVVRSSWMVGSSQCHWPPIRSSTKLAKAVREISTPKDDWPLFPVRVLYEADTYDKARRKLQAAEVESDLQTSADEENITQKRKQIANRRYISDSDSDVEPPVFSPPRTKKQCVSPSTPAENETLPQPPTTPVFSSLVQGEVHQTPRQPNSVVSPTERRLLFLLESMNAKLDDLSSRLNESTKKVDILLAGGKEDEDDLSDAFDFPLQTIEAVTRLDEQLKSDKMFERAMVRHLSLIGGRTVEDTVRRTMSHCLSNTLAQKFNWIGKGDKTGFAHTELNNMIYKAIQQNRSCRKVTKAEVEQTQKAWLRYAKDRDGGRKRRGNVIT